MASTDYVSIVLDDEDGEVTMAVSAHDDFDDDTDMSDVADLLIEQLRAGEIEAGVEVDRDASGQAMIVIEERDMDNLTIELTASPPLIEGEPLTAAQALALSAMGRLRQQLGDEQCHASDPFTIGDDDAATS